MNRRGFSSDFDHGVNLSFIRLSFSSCHYLNIRFWYALFPALEYSAMSKLFPSVHCCCFSLGFISIIKRFLYKLIMVCLNPSRCENSVINITVLTAFLLLLQLITVREHAIDEEHRAHKFLHQHLLQVQI